MGSFWSGRPWLGSFEDRFWCFCCRLSSSAPHKGKVGSLDHQVSRELMVLMVKEELMVQKALVVPVEMQVNQGHQDYQVYQEMMV